MQIDRQRIDHQIESVGPEDRALLGSNPSAGFDAVAGQGMWQFAISSGLNHLKTCNGRKCDKPKTLMCNFTIQSKGPVCNIALSSPLHSAGALVYSRFDILNQYY